MICSGGKTDVVFSVRGAANLNRDRSISWGQRKGKSVINIWIWCILNHVFFQFSGVADIKNQTSRKGVAANRNRDSCILRASGTERIVINLRAQCIFEFLFFRIFGKLQFQGVFASFLGFSFSNHGIINWERNQFTLRCWLSSSSLYAPNLIIGTTCLIRFLNLESSASLILQFGLKKRSKRKKNAHNMSCRDKHDNQHQNKLLNTHFFKRPLWGIKVFSDIDDPDCKTYGIFRQWKMKKYGHIHKMVINRTMINWQDIFLNGVDKEYHRRA